jgi:CHAT domain
MRLGDSYWAAQKPWSYSEPIYDLALKAGLGSTGAGTNLPVRAAARLAFTRWVTDHESDNLSMLKEAGAFDSVKRRFSSLEALDRDTRAMFATAYLGTLERPPLADKLSEQDLAGEAVSIFVIDYGEPFARNFDIARLKRRAKSREQQAAIGEWANVRTDFDKSIRRLNAAVESPRTGSDLDKAWDASRAARNQLTVAELRLQSFFADGSFSLSGTDLVRRVQKVLDSDEVAVSLLPTRYAVYALAITADTASVRFAPVTDVELVERIRAMREALDPSDVGNRNSAVAVEALRRMRPYTIGLFEKEASSKQRWIVISHDVLRNIPLEAIPLDAGASEKPDLAVNWKSWSGLSREIGYLPSLTALVDVRSDFPASTATKPVTVVADPILPGDPRYESSFAATLSDLSDWLRRMRLSWSSDHWLGGDTTLQPVPETARLGYEVVKQLKGNAAAVFSGARATRTAIEAGGDLTNARVLVFATHGETAETFPEIGEPFLVLTADRTNSMGFDPLTASDISRLSLNAELVFLSACSTAAADGTPARAGFSGLADSFLSAGARSLVVTEWKVQTRPTYMAVTETFKAALAGNTSSGEALRRARLEVAKEFEHPSYWSAFVYIGDPRYHWVLK